MKCLKVFFWVQLSFDRNILIFFWWVSGDISDTAMITCWLHSKVFTLSWAHDGKLPGLDAGRVENKQLDGLDFATQHPKQPFIFWTDFTKIRLLRKFYIPQYLENTSWTQLRWTNIIMSCKNQNIPYEDLFSITVHFYAKLSKEQKWEAFYLDSCCCSHDPLSKNYTLWDCFSLAGLDCT